MNPCTHSRITSEFDREDRKHRWKCTACGATASPPKGMVSINMTLRGSGTVSTKDPITVTADPESQATIVVRVPTTSAKK